MHLVQASERYKQVGSIEEVIEKYAKVVKLENALVKIGQKAESIWKLNGKYILSPEPATEEKARLHKCLADARAGRLIALENLFYAWPDLDHAQF